MGESCRHEQVITSSRNISCNKYKWEARLHSIASAHHGCHPLSHVTQYTLYMPYYILLMIFRTSNTFIDVIWRPIVESFTMTLRKLYDIYSNISTTSTPTDTLLSPNTHDIMRIAYLDTIHEPYLPSSTPAGPPWPHRSSPAGHTHVLETPRADAIVARSSSCATFTSPITILMP